MYEIDGIEISDVNYDKVCLNCRHWMADTQLMGAAKVMTCTKGQGRTNPTDSCGLFSPTRAIDSMPDPNGFTNKRRKMDIWKL